MKRLFIDMDDVVADYHNEHKRKRVEGAIEYPQSQARFFENLPEIDGAAKYVRLLNQKFDTWLLSSPSVMNPYSYTEKRVWTEEHFGDILLHERLILSPDKTCIVGDFLVDDNHWNFRGELILFGTHPFYTWESVYDYLIDKA